MNDTGILKLLYEYIFEPAGEKMVDEVKDRQTSIKPQKDRQTSIKPQKAWNIICAVTD